MTAIIQGDQLRTINFGTRIEKSTGTLTSATLPLFTIAGGLVAVTNLVGRVTTAVTVANSYKLQHNPTAGTTVDLCAATDIGTTDTALGEILVVNGAKATGLVVGALAAPNYPIVMDVGQIEHVSAGTDGVILWALTYVPLENGASVVAA
ncbi:hypothetical protein [Streptomyces sp. NPDC051016]|uniref:hypothetical protein n=1 Tax=Streptomyces sp. NPDC051016 TaxID=3365638 RepID=UPI0037934B74